MERSAIRDRPLSLQSRPDFAALHPGDDSSLLMPRRRRYNVRASGDVVQSINPFTAFMTGG
jgi:hypothetical protein